MLMQRLAWLKPEPDRLVGSRARWLLMQQLTRLAVLEHRRVRSGSRREPMSDSAGLRATRIGVEARSRTEVGPPHGTGNQPDRHQMSSICRGRGLETKRLEVVEIVVRENQIVNGPY